MVLITRTELIDKSDKVCAHPDTVNVQAPSDRARERAPECKTLYKLFNSQACATTLSRTDHHAVRAA